MRVLNQRGVTLLELLVAMILMATALMGLAASFPYAMSGVTASGFQTAATLLAQECIERAKAMPYDRLVADLPASCTPNPSGFPGMTRALTIGSGTPTATTTTITVTVTFNDRQGPNQNTVATILSQ
jgi:prepilin-type N-terminal cleavage/methylation domain-containing protein